MLDPTALSAVLAPLLPIIHAHHQSSSSPFILALSGLQGSGKSTWAAALAALLTNTHNLAAAAVSLDDFYRTHNELAALRQDNPGNDLWRTRGQPGTHDEELARGFFDAVRRRRKGDGDEDDDEIRIPVFDKSLFDGQGDRLPRSSWPLIPNDPPLRVLIFEGWCLGFLPLSTTILADLHAASKLLPPSDTNTLSTHELTHLGAVNDSLARYVGSFMGPRHFDALVHLATDDVSNVYAWRLGQEHAMMERNGGRGMADDEVRRFVRGYMPAYEMYLDRLTRECFFGEGEGESEDQDGEEENKKQSGERKKLHLRVLLDVDRKVCGVDEVRGREVNKTS